VGGLPVGNPFFVAVPNSESGQGAGILGVLRVLGVLGSADSRLIEN